LGDVRKCQGSSNKRKHDQSSQEQLEKALGTAEEELQVILFQYKAD